MERLLCRRRPEIPDAELYCDLPLDSRESGKLGGGGGKALDRDNDLCGNSGFCRVDDERARAVRSSPRKMWGGDEEWEKDGDNPMRWTEKELSGIVTKAARVNVTYWPEERLEPCGSLRDIWIDFSERLITSGDEPKAV